MVEGMPETIEAEVIEIDGEAPVPASAPRRARGIRPFVVRLDRRWWPLWTLLAILGMALMLTLGVAFAAVYLVFALVRGVWRGLGGYVSSSPESLGRR